MLDTSIMLHDFFHRFPEYYPAQKVDAGQLEMLNKYRAIVHQDLEVLAQAPSCTIGTSQGIFQRFAAIIDEYLVPPSLAHEEIQYWIHNLHIDETPFDKIVALLNEHGKINIPPSLSITLAHLQHHQYQFLFTSQPWPAELLSPFQLLVPGKLEGLL